MPCLSLLGKSADISSVLNRVNDLDSITKSGANVISEGGADREPGPKTAAGNLSPRRRLLFPGFPGLQFVTELGLRVTLLRHTRTRSSILPATASILSRASCRGSFRARAVTPWAKSHTVSGLVPSSVRTVSITRWLAF